MSEILHLYHGSQYIISNPMPNFGKKYNDFGQALYTTLDIDLGREWAVNTDGNGYVNHYTLDTEGLNILYLMVPDYSPLEWLSALIENRKISGLFRAKKYLLDNFLPDYKTCDIIISYCADDSYFKYAKDFLSNRIPCEVLYEAMKYGELGEQYVIKSQKAFSQLTFINAEKVSNKKWLHLREDRDYKARHDYILLRNESIGTNGLYINDIIKNNMTRNDDTIKQIFLQEDDNAPRL